MAFGCLQTLVNYSKYACEIDSVTRAVPVELVRRTLTNKQFIFEIYSSVASKGEALYQALELI
jgi:hypothetical protein